MSYTNFWVAELCRVELATTGHVTRFNKSEWIISAYPTRYTTFKFVYDIGSSFSTSTEQGKSWLLQMNFHMISLLTFAIPGLFFLIFVFSIQLIVNVQYNFLPMTGFKPRTSGIRSDRSTNWATTTVHLNIYWGMRSLEDLYGSKWCRHKAAK